MSTFRSILASFLSLGRCKTKPATAKRRAEVISQAVSEMLEPRTMFTFIANISAPQAVQATLGYTVSLNTTGGTATKWVIDWGDGTVGAPDIQTYINNAGFPKQYQPPAHIYQLQGQYPIKATAFITALNISSIAGLTLSNQFGDFNYAGSGKTQAKPVNSTGDARGQAMAVDRSGSARDGYIYVASNFTNSVNGVGQQFAVTRFTPTGSIDPSWANQGTLVLKKFATGTDTDTPTAIDISPDGNFIAVVGNSTAAGWAVAAIDVGDGTLLHPAAVLWQNTIGGSSIAGQANGVTVGDFDDGVFTVVGTDATQTHMVAGRFDASNGMLVTNWGDPDGLGVGGQTGKVIVPNNILEGNTVLPGNAAANTVIEKLLTNEIVIGGSESYCRTTNSFSASDMVLVSLDAAGRYVNTFGNNGVKSINIGYSGGGVQACGVNAPSWDSDYSLIQSVNPISGALQITAVGSSFQSVNNQGYQTKFAVERFNAATGALNVSIDPAHPSDPPNDGFGPIVTSGGVHAGFAFGPSGTAYGAALDDTSDHQGAIVAVGTGSSNFLAARFTTDGSLDENFGTHGVVGNTDFGENNGPTNTIDFAKSVFIRRDGSILVGGYDITSGTTGQMALADLLDMNKVNVFA